MIVVRQHFFIFGNRVLVHPFLFVGVAQPIMCLVVVWIKIQNRHFFLDGLVVLPRHKENLADNHRVGRREWIKLLLFWPSATARAV